MIDDEGMLTRGAVYLDLQPGMGYYSKIKAIPSEEKQAMLLKLNELKKKIQQKYDIPDELIEIDPQKLRLLTGSWILQEIGSELKNKCAIVIEYPTFDHLEVQVEFLN